MALAVDSKPWAVPFAAVILLLPGVRAWLRSAAAAAIGVAGAWLPFFVAAPNTTRALRFTIGNHALSALCVLGVHDPRTPFWDRPALRWLHAFDPLHGWLVLGVATAATVVALLPAEDRSGRLPDNLNEWRLQSRWRDSTARSVPGRYRPSFEKGRAR